MKQRPPYEPDDIPSWQWWLLPLLCWETYAIVAVLAATVYIAIY